MKKQGLTWKSRTLPFQNSSWKSGKSEKAKASFDVCQALSGEKSSIVSKCIGKSKSEILRFAKLIPEKGSSDDYASRLKKRRAREIEEMELA